MSSSEKPTLSFGEWSRARAVVEEQLQTIGKALEKIRSSSLLQDAFAPHDALAVHRQGCEACPPAREDLLIHVGGTSERDSPPAHIQDQTRAPAKMKRLVSTCSQTTARLHMSDQDEVDNCDIGKTSDPSSMTCQAQTGESHTDINRLDKPASEKVYIKLEMLEDAELSDVLHMEEDLWNVDAGSSKDEETPSEGEQKSKHSESDGQHHLTAKYSHVVSHQVPMEENPHDRADGQHQLTEKYSHGYQGLHVATPGCSSDVHVVSHQVPIEGNPHDRADGTIDAVSGANSDELGWEEISHGDSHVTVQKTSRTDDGTSHAVSGLNSDVLGWEEVPHGDRHVTVEKTSRADDGTSNAVSGLNSDVLGWEEVPHGDRHMTVEKTSRADDGTIHTSSTPNCDILVKELETSADQWPTGLDSVTMNENIAGSVGKKKFQCSHCSNSYSHMNAYKKHLGTHTSHSLHCSVCNNSFAEKLSFDLHARTCLEQQKSDKSFKCRYCTYTCATKRSLKIHKRVHKLEKCDRPFQSPGKPEGHMGKHTREKPHTHKNLLGCHICNYKCASKAHLTRHIRVHTGEKPFKCSFCDKGFTQSGDLTRHMRTHSGEKPYSCHICDYRFTQQAHLTNHLRLHTG